MPNDVDRRNDIEEKNVTSFVHRYQDWNFFFSFALLYMLEIERDFIL